MLQSGLLRKQDNLLEQHTYLARIENLLQKAWLDGPFVELHFSSSFNYILSSSLVGALALIESTGSYKEKKYGITS